MPIKPQRTPQIVIVGAGPGGLAAALLLARAGVRVHVVEKQPQVGGRCSSFTAQGFRFDLGPTFFLYPRVLERIYRHLGRNLFDDVPMSRLDPQYRLIFGSGGELLCTSDVARMKAEIARLSPADAANLERFLSDNRAKLEAFRPILERPFLGWRDLLQFSLLRLLPKVRPWLALDGELARYFSDPRIRLAFSFQSKYLGMSPFSCPSLFSILSFLEYEHGVWHPRGGCGAVSEAMARLAADMGATITCGEPVREILFDRHRAVGVRTERGVIRADAVVVNADFARAMTNLIPDRLRRRWSNARIEKKRYSCSTFMMYLGIDGMADLDHHTIYTASDYRQNLEDIEVLKRLSDDPSFYIQNAGITDDSLAPPGCSTLYVLAPVPHQNGNIDWTRDRVAFRAKVLRQLEKLGLHNLENRIRFERIVTPQCWENDFDVYRGATFNLAHTWRQMLHLRPRNRFEDVDGLYLVGGGTHPGSGLPVIYESARISSRLLLDDLGLDTAWLEDDDSPTGNDEASRWSSVLPNGLKGITK